MSEGRVAATPLTRGRGRGECLGLDVGLSFWGGVDWTGTIVDAHHPGLGASLAGRVLAMPSGRGSSSSSSVLAELIRSGQGPCAVVLARADPIIALGAIVADELYAVAVPVVLVDAADLHRVRGDVSVTSDPAAGTATLTVAPHRPAPADRPPPG